MYQIAIDGPSGAGKSTLARRVARELHFVYVDTGALYRAVGLYISREKIDPSDTDAVVAALPQIKIGITYRGDEQRVLLNGEDVSEAIRENAISQYASKVSAIPGVRSFLLDLQRDMAKTHDVVMDGRDIGTVIFPQAQVKIFLVANDETRARRRCAELEERGQHLTFESVLADIRARDLRDSQREVAPAVAAPDAVLLDNSGMNFEQTVQAALAVIRSKI